MKVIFHLAFPINDIEETKKFYVDGLGCSLGRETKKAIILGLDGHQLTGHLEKNLIIDQKGIYPRHFGLIFYSYEEWKGLYNEAKVQGLTFYREPTIRFKGRPTEHGSFFLKDPSNNLLEFKYYKNKAAILGVCEDAPEIGETK